MIWIWISCCVIFSLIFLWKIGGKVNYNSLVWLLMPIDMYGITVAGFTIKPFMIVMLLIASTKLLQLKEVSFSFPAYFIVSNIFLLVCCFGIELLHDNGMIGINTLLLLTIVFLCAYIYVLSIDSYNQILNIMDSIIASGFGYGLVFMVLAMLASSGIELPAVVAPDRVSVGILQQFINVDGFRLRGFFIDPNVLLPFMVLAQNLSLRMALQKKSLVQKLPYLLTIVILFICIFYSNSRASIIISFATLLLSLFSFKHIKIVITLAIIVIVTIIVNHDLIMNIDAIFSERSSFTDEYGRGSIWMNNFKVFIDTSPFLGLGLRTVANYTGRDCHNTYLEWIVGYGLSLGTFAILFFVSNLVNYIIFYVKNKNKMSPKIRACLCGLLWGGIGTFCTLFTVTMLCNAYFIFLTVIFAFIPYNKKILDKEGNSI